MKRILMVTMMLAGLGATGRAQTPLATPRAERARIAQGIRDGSLTRAEAARLLREQKQLRRHAVRDRVDGGGLTRAERQRLRAEARRNSRQIARLRHNRGVR